VSAVQQLKDADYQKRFNYSEWFTNFITQNGQGILDVTFYTNEVWFHLSGHVNTKNTCLWCTENPHAIVEEPVHSDKIGIWVAISRRRIICPIFFTETINSEYYCLHMLFPFSSQLNEDEINCIFSTRLCHSVYIPLFYGIIGRCLWRMTNFKRNLASVFT
jgi:hypothetical protein